MYGTYARAAVSTVVRPSAHAMKNPTPKGGTNRPEPERRDHERAVVQRIDAEPRDDGKEHRHEDDHRGHALEDRAERHEDEDGDEQHQRRVRREPQQHRGDQPRDALRREDPRQHGGRADQQHHHARQRRGADQHGQDVARADLAVDHQPQQEGIEHGEHRRLGGGHDPAEDPAQDDGRRDQREHAARAGPGHLSHRSGAARAAGSRAAPARRSAP